MDWLITPLSQEQLQELKSMKNESPSYYKKIVSSFEKNVRAYRDYDIYGIGMYFSKDIWQLARYYEYQIFKSK
jgi:hypothetical protein